VNITDNRWTTNLAGTVVGGNLVLTLNRDNLFRDVSTDSNTQAVGEALDQISDNGPTGDMLKVLSELDAMATAKEIDDSIKTFHGDVSSGVLDGSRVVSNQFLGGVGNRLGFVRSGLMDAGIQFGAPRTTAERGVATGDLFKCTGIWVEAVGSHSKQGSRGGIEGFQANAMGTVIGFDKLIEKHIRMGFAGGYGFADVKSKTPGRPTTGINSWQAAVYASYDSIDLAGAEEKNRQGSRGGVRDPRQNSWYADGIIAFTQNNYDSRREIYIPGDDRVAKADHYGQQYSSRLEMGYTFLIDRLKALAVTPFTSLEYGLLYMNQYKENGADALNLNVNGKAFNLLEQGIGLKLAYSIISKKFGTFIPSIKGAWRYAYLSDRFETASTFEGGGPLFRCYGANPARNSALIGAELAFLNKGNMTLTGNWDMELKDQYVSNTYYGTARFDF
jgi:outer membrane autotransporter protein